MTQRILNIILDQSTYIIRKLFGILSKENNIAVDALIK